MAISNWYRSGVLVLDIVRYQRERVIRPTSLAEFHQETHKIEVVDSLTGSLDNILTISVVRFVSIILF